MSKRLVDKGTAILVLAPRVANAPTTQYVSLKGYDRATFVIQTRNTTSVTANTFSLSQATAVSGTNAKALNFTSYLRSEGVSGSDTATGVVTVATTNSNAFTGATTNNSNNLYLIEVQRDQLDLANDFDCVGVSVAGAAANSTTSVLAVLHEPSYNEVPNFNPLTN